MNDTFAIIIERHLGPCGAFTKLKADHVTKLRQQFETALIEYTGQRCDGNQTRMADALGYTRNTLTKRLKALGIPNPAEVRRAARREELRADYQWRKRQLKGARHAL